MQPFILTCVILHLIFTYSVSSLADISPTIKTITGIYQGFYEKSYNGTEYASFLGIKYADPVLFQLAKPVAPSDDLKNATQYGSACLQPTMDRHTGYISIAGSHDCLFINVHTCYRNQMNESGMGKSLLPVLVFIHGGAFIGGSGNYSASYWMDSCRLVFVTIQYRLGVLGFNDFGNDAEYPANLGLKDQILALKWIQENIGNFGGDPTRVTLQGQSAGAASVHLHMVSPLSKGLFRAGISESGNACSPWSIRARLRSRKILIQVLAKTDCLLVAGTLETKDFKYPASAAALCLSKLTPSSLVIAAARASISLGLLINPFGPVLEDPDTVGAFITEYPWKAPIKTSVPWLSGVNSDETMYIIPVFPKWIFDAAVMAPFHVIPALLLYDYSSPSPTIVTEMIERFYLPNELPNKNNIVELLKKAGNDDSFLYPNWECHNLQMGSPTTFNYYFDYILSPLKNDSGAIHSGELPLLNPYSTDIFPTPLDIRRSGSAIDRAVSFKMVEIWTKFAELEPIEFSKSVGWKAWDPLVGPVMEIDRKGNFFMTTNPGKKGIDFWSRLPFR